MTRSTVSSIEPLRYDKITEPITAIRWDGSVESADAVAHWMNQGQHKVTVTILAGDGKWLPTHEHYLQIIEQHIPMIVRQNDYVIYTRNAGPVSFFKLDEFQFNQRYVMQDRYDIMTDDGMYRTFQPGKYAQ